MANIIELALVLAEADTHDGVIVQGIWNSRDATADLADARGHAYWRLVSTSYPPNSPPWNPISKPPAPPSGGVRGGGTARPNTRD